jgi:predicted transcriptional regulator with HTH domain
MFKLTILIVIITLYFVLITNYIVNFYFLCDPVYRYIYIIDSLIKEQEVIKMFNFFEITRSRLRSKLLSFYFANKDEVLYIKEISRALDEDCGNLQKELVKLEKEGFLQSVKRGNQRYYLLNKEYLFFNELDSIFAKISSEPFLNPANPGDSNNFLSGKTDLITETVNKKIYGQALSKKKDATLAEQFKKLLSSFKEISSAFLFGDYVLQIKKKGHSEAGIYLCIITSQKTFDNLNFNSKIEKIKKGFSNKLEYVIFTSEEWKENISLKKGFIFGISKRDKIILLDSENLL